MAAHQLRHGSNFTGKRGSNTVSTQQAGRGPGIKRRTIVQGVAWSVPVVVAAQALPAFATSPLDITGTILGVCKYPGGSATGGCKQDYRAQVQFCNTNSNPADITTVSVDYPASFGSSNLPFEALYTGDGTLLTGSSFTVQSGQCLTFNIVYDGTNSANTTGTFLVTFVYVVHQPPGSSTGDATYTATTQITFTQTPPDCGGVCGT